MAGLVLLPRRVECPERAKRVEGPYSILINRADDAIVVLMVCVVYILRCSDSSLYIGHTADLADRIRRHNAGEACAFTAKRRPVEIVHTEVFDDRLEAVARERQLKGWTRAKKEALITRNLRLLKRL